MNASLPLERKADREGTMNRSTKWTRIKYTLASAIAIGAAAITINSIGCSSNDSSTTTTLTTDPYVYYVYLPDDVAIASFYWTNDWAYANLYAVPATGAVTTVADAIRALARGETVCGSAAAVTARTRTPVCTGAPTQSRGGATIVFNNCQTPGGGTINGTVDISSSATASSAACTGTTMITLSHTTTITNLSYVGPNGNKAVIPQQVDTGTNTYTFGSLPASINLSTMGQLQTFAADGTEISDTSYTGTPTISFGGSTSSYTEDGTFTTTSNLVSGAGATYNLMGVTRVSTCCRPVGGSVQVSRNSGASNTYTFGPNCGDVTLDGQVAASVPTCL
jgi:hypothetical protein